MYLKRKSQESQCRNNVEIERQVENVIPPWLGAKEVWPSIVSTKDIIQDDVDRNDLKLSVSHGVYRNYNKLSVKLVIDNGYQSEQDDGTGSDDRS